MKTKVFGVFFTLLIISFTASAQDRIPFSQNSSFDNQFKEVRALVVGISNYKNLPMEKQLEYASDDAMGFYNFLKSRPDVIKPQNIISLFNEEATNEIRIKSILYNLIVKESEKNDLVIIYYAGHGDIQNLNSSADEGFLLLHDVSRDGDYMAPGNDVISISEIQKYISMAPEGVKVLLITDACHSGKLVSNEDAAQKVLSSLVKDWENTYKLVSSQVNQTSYESEKWGGGHGVFTYYLLYGMKGLADENEDNNLQFFELYDFVKENVQKATNYNQIPKAKGDETITLFPIDERMKQKALTSYPHKEKISESQEKQETYSPFIPDTERSGNNYFYQIPSQKRYLLNYFQKMVDNGELVPEYSESLEYSGPINIQSKKVFDAHEKNAFAIAISNKTNIIATGGRDQEIRLWNAKNLEQIGSLKHQGVKSLRFSFDDRFLISGAWDNQVKIWNIEDREPIQILRVHSDDILAVSFSDNGELMATAGHGDSLKIWELNQWSVIESFPRIHNKEVNDLVFDTSNAFITAGGDGKILRRKLDNGSVLSSIQRNAGINDLQYLPDKNWIIGAEETGSLFVLDANNLNLINTWNVSKHSINSITADPGGQYLFIGGKAHELLVFDIKKEKIIERIPVPRGITDLKINSSEGMLAGVMYGGKGIRIQMDNLLPPPAGNAYEIYLLLLSSSELTHLHDRIRGYLASALQSFAVEIINPFINGADNLPALEKIQQAKIYLHYAKKLYDEKNTITQRIEINYELLDIFEVMVTQKHKAIPEAIEKVKEIMKIHEDASYTYTTLSNLYRRLNELQKAKESGEVAAERIPTWTEPKARVGQAYFKEGKYDDALKEFDKIVELRPDIAKGYKFRGDVYTFLGNFEKAEEQYKLASKKEQDNAGVLYHKARLNILTRNYDEAENLLEQCNKQFPDFVKSRLLLGRLYNYRFLDSFEKRGRTQNTMIEKSYQILAQAS
ncbi:MAG: caspase family protein [Bacteroidales bacterium]